MNFDYKTAFELVHDTSLMNNSYLENEFDHEIIKSIINKGETLLRERNVSNRVVRFWFHNTVELVLNAIRYGIKNGWINYRCNIQHDNLIIYCDNELTTDKVDSFKAQLEEVNSLETRDEIKRYYIIKIKSSNRTRHVGIGLVDIRRRSTEQLLYNFEKITETTSKFSIIVIIHLTKPSQFRNNHTQKPH